MNGPRPTLRTEIEVCDTREHAVLDDPPGYWAHAVIDLDAVTGVRQWIDTATGEAKPGTCILDYDGEGVRCRMPFEEASDAFERWKAYRWLTVNSRN